MKLLLFALLTLILAVAAAIWAMGDPGYVLFAVGNWTLETTLALTVIVLLVVFAGVHYLLRMITGVKKFPREVKNWRHSRHERKAENTLTQGLIELAEGNWQAAEKHVVKYAEGGFNPLLNYLAAARAAQAQGDDQRRDTYLKLAHEKNPRADIAIGLTQAELQLSQNQLEQALATLRHLQQLSPKHAQVLKALTHLYRELGDWEHLLEILPVLKKRKILPEELINSYAKQAYLALLTQERHSGLAGLWSRIPPAMREDADIVTAYVQALIAAGDSDLVEPIIRQALKKSVNDPLMKLYGEIDGADPTGQLAFVESVLLNQENNASTLLTAGRLSLRNQLWGKASDYLKASIQAQPTAEAYNELGHLLEKMGDQTAATNCFRAGLKLVPGCKNSVAHQLPDSIETLESLPAGKATALEKSAP